MKTEEFDYDLPPGLIAQEPLRERAASRMLVLDRGDGGVAHREFRDLARYLAAGDVLVLNDTRVIPARLRGVKAATGGRVELLFLERRPDGDWDALMRAPRRPRVGEVVILGSGAARAQVVEDGERGRCRLRVVCEEGVDRLLEREGEAPLPPYIRRDGHGGQAAADRDRYQTVYATAPGAVAAPTAGLHFTEAVLEDLAARGIASVRLTLHVGIGTFRPVTARHVEDHRMEAERYELTPSAAARINQARVAGGRIVAVGSTCVRTLETLADPAGSVHPGAGRTELFITPPYPFRAVDIMLTNFHLPRSTLLMMVCAFAGKEQVMAAYREAVQRQYRFFSYGDCMLITGTRCGEEGGEEEVNSEQ